MRTNGSARLVMAAFLAFGCGASEQRTTTPIRLVLSADEAARLYNVAWERELVPTGIAPRTDRLTLKQTVLVRRPGAGGANEVEASLRDVQLVGEKPSYQLGDLTRLEGSRAILAGITDSKDGSPSVHLFDGAGQAMSMGTEQDALTVQLLFMLLPPEVNVDFLPEKPVAIGSSWEIDKGLGRVTLLRAESCGDLPCYRVQSTWTRDSARNDQVLVIDGKGFVHCLRRDVRASTNATPDGRAMELRYQTLWSLVGGLGATRCAAQ